MYAAQRIGPPGLRAWRLATRDSGSHIEWSMARSASSLFVGATLALSLCSCGDGGSVTVPDEIAPNVTITQPAPGPVSGTVTLVAEASDNVGVVGVRFLMNDVVNGPDDTEAPYQLSWDTEHLPNISFELTAIARDAAGNEGTSPPVTVSVQNTAGFGRFGVSVTVSGGGADPDGFVVLVDGLPVGTVGTDLPVVLEARVGIHEVRLDGLAPTCRVTSDADQTIEVTASQLIPLVEFTVECAAAAG